MGLKVAAQLNWRLPDVIVYRGRAASLVACGRRFDEMEQLGGSTERPRMIVVKTPAALRLCATFEEGADHARRLKMHTRARGLRGRYAIAITHAPRPSAPKRRDVCCRTDDEMFVATKQNRPSRRPCSRADGAAKYGRITKMAAERGHRKHETAAAGQQGTG